MPLSFGLAVMNDFPPDVRPADRLPMIREQVRTAEAAGISSIWVLQHYLGSMPTLQPLPLLAALAADAGEMALGTNMFILPLRHPVAVAEEFATLDHITQGRAIAGFGMGYRENEFDAFGIALEERVGRFKESVEIISRLWAGEDLVFTGDYYTIRGEHISLPPVREGGPPMWIGAGPHRAGALRAARLGDAWIVPPHVTPEKLADVLSIYRDERERLGRGASELVVRREMLLHEDADRARELGLQARSALTNRYAAYNKPQGGEAYRHLDNADAATEVADASYLFTDPAGAIDALRALEAQGLTTIILRAQWYDLAQEHVLRTLQLFAEEVLPALR